MNALLKRSMTISFVVMLFALLSGCTFGTRLDAVMAPVQEVSGTYRLYLYGCRYPDDAENLALLVDQSTPYRIELYVKPTSYKVRQDLPAADALAAAQKFIRCSQHEVWTTSFRRIADPEGRTIAFELEPRYYAWDVGAEEPLVTSYSLRNDTVTVYISPNPMLEHREQFDELMDSHGQ
jgi:hypothetical protein